MNKIYSFLITAACVSALCACGDTGGGIPEPTPVPGHEGGENGNGQMVPIMFSSSHEGAELTRALADFPNSGRIGVVAAYYNANTAAIDWTSYDDIFDARATANAENAGIFSFRWATQKYWPFDGSDLVFLAYSPDAASYPSAMQLGADGKSLSLSLQENMPDVMFASHNEHFADITYNKFSGTVFLGQFRHALSQLTVNIIADPTMNPSVKVSHLSVSTQRKGATLDLLAGDSGITLSDPGNHTYNLVNSSAGFSPGKPLTYVRYFYPATEGETTLDITLVDGPFSVTKSYPITLFLTKDKNPVKLERAKNTIVNITVKGTLVEEPDENIILEGIIGEWNQKGNFGVTIN